MMTLMMTRIQNQVEHPDGFFLAKRVNGWKLLTISVKKLHHRCSAGFYIGHKIRLLSIYIRTSEMPLEWPCIMLQKFFFKKNSLLWNRPTFFPKLRIIWNKITALRRSLFSLTYASSNSSTWKICFNFDGSQAAYKLNFSLSSTSSIKCGKFCLTYSVS